jgi:HPt (histidine-containing phosphotransfer) domain-containing protein
VLARSCPLKLKRKKPKVGHQQKAHAIKESRQGFATTPPQFCKRRMSHDPHHSNATPAPMVLDAVALDALRALDPQGGDGVMKRVLVAFERSLASMLVQLQSHLQPQPQAPAGQSASASEAVFRIAHTLKAPAASCGAPALAQLAREVEQRHRPGASPNSTTSEELRADVTRLTVEGEAVLMAVRAILRY